MQAFRRLPTLVASAGAALLVTACAASSASPSPTPTAPSAPATPSTAAPPAAQATSFPTSKLSATESPSPTAASLNLTWTKVALDETFADGNHHTPRVAWVGDRYVLVDEESGRVQTSIDGSSWQILQPGDPDPGYADLLRQRLASWQGDVVGWWNEDDGPDTTAKPPAKPRHIVTVVHAPATPIATKSFTREIESIGIGHRGIVAEVHSSLDPNENPSNDPGSGWYSPTGKQWTQMARRTTSSDLPGARLPTRAFGQVVGVSDGFIASGGSPDSACSNPDGCGGGMWYSADGLTWRFLGLDPDPDFDHGLVPWMGGALERQGAGFGLWTEALVTNGAGHFDFWTSAGLTKLPVPTELHGIVGTGPLGFVDVAYDKQEAFVSRNGIDYGSSPIPAEMAHENLGGTGHPPTIVVGDRTILVLERYANEIDPTTWSLWLGTFQP